MHTPAFVSLRPFASAMPAPARLNLSSPLAKRRALRVWLNQPDASRHL
jgi:hypothetical protein